MGRRKVDDTIYIDIDESSDHTKSIYIRLQADKVFPAIMPRTENISDSPHINVDRIGNAVIGIEILL